MITMKSSGNFNNTSKFLKGVTTSNHMRIFEKYGRIGVDALSTATPFDSGETAKSWKYQIEQYKGGVALSWINTNTNDGVSIAIILQYGHATGSGAYVQGHDYINPAIRPIFNNITNEMWREVTKR